jgi:hypothetical protein
MNNDPFSKLQQFLATLSQRGVVTDLQTNDFEEKPSRFVDAQGETAIGRITVWASDEWELETISIESEETTFTKYLNHPTDVELSETLAIWESHMQT